MVKLLAIAVCLVVMAQSVYMCQFKKYEAQDIKLSFDKAVEHCENKNMKLAVIRSPKENTEVAAEVKRLQDSKVDKKGKLKNIVRYETYWTSGNDKDAEGSYVWKSTGSGLLFANWFKDATDPTRNEPNDSDGTQDCILVYGDQDTKWFDEKCDQDHLFVCEYFKKC